MQNTLISYEEFQKKIRSIKSPGDMQTFLQQLSVFVPTLADASPIDAPIGKGRGRWRRSVAPVTEEQKSAPSKPPALKEAKFKPLPSRKYETVEDEMEEKIIAMYAKGLTTRDIQAYLRDIYQMSISTETVSGITDKVLPLVKEWQVRPLSRMYPILHLDGLHFKVRDTGKIVNRCAYILLGINEEGRKEVLGIWIGETEGAKFWMQVLTEIKNRGVEDVLICCIDGLRGFSDAINAIFPEAIIQQCIFHQIRHTVKFVPHRHKKHFCEDLRKIYAAPTEEAALEGLQEVRKAWPQFDLSLKSWETKWSELSTFFGYPEQLRRIIYPNNAIENLNRQFRKVTKTSQMFPHNEALQKLLWLAQHDITQKWRLLPVDNWGEIMTQLAVLFPQKIAL